MKHIVTLEGNTLLHFASELLSALNSLIGLHFPSIVGWRNTLLHFASNVSIEQFNRLAFSLVLLDGVFHC
jgi:hypothetical protein